jgi:hypothetical protein
MNTGDRLRHYGVFDDDVIESVQTTAQWQNSLHLEELVDRYKFVGGPEKLVPSGCDNPIVVLALKPEDAHDERAANVYFTPFALSVDVSIAMRAMRLFGSDPTKPLYVVGNLNGAYGSEGNVSREGVKTMKQDGSLAPDVTPAIRFLIDRNIERPTFLGYSYGADKAAAAVNLSHEEGIPADGGVFVEPVGVVARSRLKLLKQFKKSGEKLADFVEDADSKPLNQARARLHGTLKTLDYALGLRRPANRAIASILARDGFETSLDTAIGSIPDGYFHLSWGEQSEISIDAHTARIARNLSEKYGENRFGWLRVPGMKHAGGDDIDLHAAIMLQGLKRPGSPIDGAVQQDRVQQAGLPMQPELDFT